MHWQFGGNLEPVQTVCETDWKECPRAIANYIWSEVVTDVVECLTNEGIIWRVLAIFFVSMMLVRTIYSKRRRLKDSARNRKFLKKVDCKVDDLELKVNILTYKMQYGLWPLPHQILKSRQNKGIRNVRLTLSGTNDYNDWIKHVFLSPKKVESCISHSGSNYSSETCLTEMFDTKDVTGPTENTSTKSSKSSIDRFVDSTFLEKNTRRDHEESETENTDIVPLLSRKRNTRSASRMPTCKTTNYLFNDKARSCKKFMKTMDECKSFLRELHSSNKSLGLVYSSTSETSSIKDIWPATQPTFYYDTKNESNKSRNQDESEKETGIVERNSGNNSNGSHTVSPVVKFVDHDVLPSNLNMRFCTEMFPQQPIANILLPPAFKRHKIVETSEETLHEIKRKLSSLYNVLRKYEVNNSELKSIERRNYNTNKPSNVCRNIMDILVSITAEIENLNEKKKSKVSFDTKVNQEETPRFSGNNAEQIGNDDGRNSEISTQSYYNALKMYEKCGQGVPLENSQWLCNRSVNLIRNVNQLENKENNDEPKIIISKKKREKSGTNSVLADSVTDIKCKRIPERVYYSFSIDSLHENDIVVSERGSPKKDNRKLDNDCYTVSQITDCGEQYPIPMDIEDDIIISPISSRTEVSKDSESDDKSTVVLLEEALKLKKAILSRSEIQKTSSLYNSKTENVRHDSTTVNSDELNVGNYFHSKLLDIITEEQSVSSSTERTSRTYIFLNPTKEEKVEYKNVPSTHHGHESKQILGAISSEYFSSSNIIDNHNRIDGNKLCLSRNHYDQQNELSETLADNFGQRNEFENRLFYEWSTNSPSHAKESNDTIPENTATSKVERDFMCEEEFERVCDREQLLKIDNTNEVADRNEVRMSHNANTELDIEINSTKNEKCMEDNEMYKYHPNLILKRHPGMCSLIEQTSTASSEPQSGMCKMLENTESTFESSISNSRETTAEINLMDNSESSDMNHSNDIHILGSSNTAVLTERIIDNEELNFKCHNFEGDVTDNYRIKEEYNQTFSANTITIDESDATGDTKSNCSGERKVCNKNTTDVAQYEKTEVFCSQKDQHGEIQSIPPMEESAEVDNKPSISKNETNLSRSHLNLVSPHSSLYFTDEVPSSIAILKNTRPRDLDEVTDSNSKVQKLTDQNINEIHQYQEENFDRQAASNVQSDIIVDKCEIPRICKLDKESAFHEIQADNRNDKEDNSITNKIVLNTENNFDEFEEGIQPTLTKIILNHNVKNDVMSSESSKNLSERPILNTSIQTKENINVFYSNALSHQMSPCNVKNNIATKQVSTSKVNTQEKSISKSEISKKSDSDQNMKSTKPDQLHNNQPKGDGNVNSVKRLRGLSADSTYCTRQNNNVEKKRSRSQINVRTKESMSNVNCQPRDSPNSEYITRQDSFLESKTRSKSLMPTPKSSSRSCIPILKRRLEATRKVDNEVRPRSPMRGPLTVTMLWKDASFATSSGAREENVQAEGISTDLNHFTEGSGISTVNANARQNSVDVQQPTKSPELMENINDMNIHSIAVPHEKMVIYVNIFTKDCNTTRIVDPHKFLKYIEDREINTRNVCNENQHNTTQNVIYDERENESTMYKVVTIISSAVSEKGLMPNSFPDSNIKTETISAVNPLSSKILKQLCFLTVEQREIDVTAKPSVADRGTSISDLQGPSSTLKVPQNKFQICGTPKELNNEEYVAFLDILNQKSNYVHLQELQKLCKKLISEHKTLE